MNYAFSMASKKIQSSRILEIGLIHLKKSPKNETKENRAANILVVFEILKKSNDKKDGYPFAEIK